MRPLRRLPAPRRSSQAGFSLLELLITLALMGLVLALAAGLLTESSRLLVETAGEQRDAPVPLILARIRGDVLGASSFVSTTGEDGEAPRLLLVGHPQGTLQYEQVGDELRRGVIEGGRLRHEVTVWRGLVAWSCARVPVPGLDEPRPDVLRLDFHYRRRSTPRTPLPVLPFHRGPVEETRTETLFLVPRGNGLGTSW
jgi:prepilin-type N-terminal cleavage/methylation domain-containing protein